MSWKSFLLCCAGIFALFTAAILGLRSYNADLREQAARLPGATRQAAALQDENRRLELLLARLQRDMASGRATMEAEVERSRHELADLQRERQQLAPEEKGMRKAEADAMAMNRDPLQGPVQLENFQNLGRDTPENALQTFVWAVTSETDDAVASSLAIEAAGREKLEQWLAALPKESRAKYRTPEHLAALFLTSDILKKNSLQILGTKVEPSGRATLRMRIDSRARETTIGLERHTQGWLIAVSTSQVEKLLARLSTPN